MTSSASLQRVLDDLVADGVPGVLAELRQDTGTWRLSSGVAELGTCRPVDPLGWFRIGSVTKTFTAAVVLQLVGEGRLGLDDTVQRWVPDVVPGATQITVRHLLNHTSGLPNYTRDLTTDSIIRDRFTRWTPYDVVMQACRHQPEFQPGTSRVYNNTGYVLLGMVIEQATGYPFGAQVERRILRPLGLAQTVVGNDGGLLPEPHAHGYLAVKGELVDITTYNPSHAAAAGSMASTAADLNRFFAELLAGNLLREPERRTMQTTIATAVPGVDSGLGIARYTLPDGLTLWGKAGGFHGYRTWSVHTADASQQLTVSMTVAHTAGPTTEQLLARIRSVFDPWT